MAFAASRVRFDGLLTPNPKNGNGIRTVGLADGFQQAVDAESWQISAREECFGLRRKHPKPFATEPVAKNMSQ